MPTPHPHAHYAAAVMAALGDLYDPTESWTSYDCDNGEVMLMELLITLDPGKARAAGWPHGLFLYWDQTTGWEWMELDKDGRGNNPGPLASPPVCTPETLAQAVRQLLTPDGWKTLPVQGEQRETDGPLPEELTALVAELDDVVTDEDTAAAITDTLRALAAYSKS